MEFIRALQYRTEEHVISFLIAVAMIAIAVIVLVAASTPSKPCRWNTIDQSCIDYRFAQCIATDKYSRLECAILIRDK